MTVETRDGREVELELGGARDDVQIESATYVETGEEIPDAVLDEILEDYEQEIDEAFVDQMAAHADMMYDRWKDGDFS